MKESILKYGAILLVGFFLEWLLVTYSPWDLPDSIPFEFDGPGGTTNTSSIRIEGIFLAALIIIIISIALKQFLKTKPGATIFELTVLGTAICFSAEIIFRVFMLSISNDTLDERIHYFLLGTIWVTLVGAILTFSIAYQLKTKNAFGSLLILVAFGLTLKGVMHFFPGIFK